MQSRRPRKTDAVWPPLAAMDHFARCVGFTTGGSAVVWRWPRWRCNSSSHSGMSISTASIALTPLSLSAVREPRRHTCPRRNPATTPTTTIARSAPRSFWPPTLSCRRCRNCRCRLFLERSSISLASPSISSCRGARHFNHALRRSPDRLLLIFRHCRALF